MELTREEMVADLISLVDEWPIDTLIDWTKEALQSVLDDYTDEEIRNEYKLAFDEEFTIFYLPRKEDNET